MNPIFILLFMLFCHIIDDYFLQAPCLSFLKQRDWWKKNAADEQYKHDYLMALGCHAFSWAFMIMLPIAIATSWNMGWLFLAYPINMIIHAVVDDIKANKFKINLIVDQSIHFIQIGLTFLTYCLMFIR